MIDFFGLGILGSFSAMGQQQAVADLQYRANQEAYEQMRVYWRDIDSNTIDFDTDAVREVRAPLLLGWDLAESADSDGGPGAGFADSDGGECD